MLLLRLLLLYFPTLGRVPLKPSPFFAVTGTSLRERGVVKDLVSAISIIAHVDVSLSACLYEVIFVSNIA